ncbi:MAG: NADH-quinone oxidoreductase subunit NuoN [Gammaproteobacteria bacterium]
MQDLMLVLPEVTILTMACVVLMVEVYRPDPEKRRVYWLSQAALAVALFVTVAQASSGRSLAFNGVFVADVMSTALKAAILLVTLMVFAYSRHYLTERKSMKAEHFALGLFAVLGMMIIVSANSFLTIYLGLELLSLSLYAMIAVERDSRDAAEAAMKYFVLGALASGMLLYGLSMLYGVTGSLDISQIAQAVGAQSKDSQLLVFGLVFVVVGVAFKLGVAPFHMWIPDVYQGAPTSVTLFIGTAPKVSAFALAFRLLVDGLPTLVADWRGMLMIMAVLSIALGNVVAIVQYNIKRMLAYSTIAHMGYLLLGLVAGTPTGFAAAMFYAITYTVMSAAAFGMVILLGRIGFESDQLDDFKGLSERSPWFALVMLIVMFSMAGVPPFVGFWGQWFVIKEVVAVGHVWLAALAVLFSIVGAFYYLRIVRLMYFDKPDQTHAIAPNKELRWVLSANGIAVLVLGLMPGLLMELCVRAI